MNWFFHSKISLVFASALVVGLHVYWVFCTVKWTSPCFFSICFNLLLFIFLLFWAIKNLEAPLICYIVTGILFGMGISILAWWISDAIYAPYRFEYFLRDFSLIDLSKRILFTSFITGAWLAGGIQGFLLYKYMRRESIGSESIDF